MHDHLPRLRDIARNCSVSESQMRPTTNFKLGTLYQVVGGKNLEGSHLAINNVRANYDVLLDDFLQKHEIGLRSVGSIVNSVAHETLASRGNNSNSTCFILNSPIKE